MDLIDIGDNCIECGRDTSFGSGLFVNRIPADDGRSTGYLCPECQCIGCKRCDAEVLEYSYSESEGGFCCYDCLRELGELDDDDM